MSTEPRRSDATRAAILEAAQEHFAGVGYEKATIRAIAATAGIDPSLVMRYFGNKGKLFAAAADFDIHLPENLAEIPRSQLGATLVEHFVTRWEADDTMVALLRAVVSQETARARMAEIFSSQMVPVIESLTADRALERATLISTQMIGLAMCRYVIRLGHLPEMTQEQIIDLLAPTIQLYLDCPMNCPTS
ncbi:TetR/AcrR family transcriptional regulator [Mycobacterium sp. CBMA271]|uniref:TetR/AcrR family transcriptional regulator n=1 Tax=unclassified Mycobacteroides TaxID=2618759 RepID=UPI0012DF852A|nr:MULTISPECIES: TetR family transcriptional regulator [unclassified Mycobacteroides]MUM18496.1 TetR family transcriptional regulator [Mycobacteroides sp. CBMA 326]MUM23765.1 TetR/AcrR family transcriptional regulator [Mycobacteroides sp. CBMA 271]